MPIAWWVTQVNAPTLCESALGLVPSASYEAFFAVWTSPIGTSWTTRLVGRN